MKSYIRITIMAFSIIVFFSQATFAQEVERRKLAQTGMKFLMMSVDARSAGMADAATAQEGSSISMFYNPAGMASLSSALHATGSQVRWIGDIRYNIAALAFRPMGGDYGVFGFSVMAVDYGEFIGTIRADVDKGYIDTGEYSPTAMAASVGYANAISDRFSVGANLKLVRESLGSGVVSLEAGGNQVHQQFSENAIAVDFGILYRTGFRSLNFAMSLRNFSREITYEIESFELPLTFQIGLAMNMLDFTEFDSDMHSFLLSIDAVRHRDYEEQIKIGGEYLFLNTLALRAGYAYPTDEQGLNLGVGLQAGRGNVGIGVDYAYTHFGMFGNVNRIGLQFSF